MYFIMTKGLLIFLSSVIPAISTDGGSFPLSEPLNTERYKTVDMKHRLLLKHKTRKRDVSLMSKTEGNEDKIKYEMEGCLNEAFTTKDGVWIFPGTVRGGSRFANRSYIVYALVGETFIVRSWSLNYSTLSFTIKKGDMARLNASFNRGSYEISEDKNKRLVLKHNFTSKDVSLFFDKVDSEDEGQYTIEESCSKHIGDEYTNKRSSWIFHLHVLKPDDIKRSNVGENINILRLNKSSSSFPYLYHYDQICTVLKDTGCDVNSTSHFYGRLRCERDKVENRYQIEIQNVVLADTGLYRVVTNGHDTDRCFLNITDQTTTKLSSIVPSYTNQRSFPHAARSGAHTKVVTLLDTTSIQYNSEGINYSKISNESLSLTATSSSSEDTRNPQNAPDVALFIIPIVVGSVAGIFFLILGCRRRIKHNKSYSLELGARDD